MLTQSTSLLIWDQRAGVCVTILCEKPSGRYRCDTGLTAETQSTQRGRRGGIRSLRPLCALCVSAVSPTRISNILSGKGVGNATQHRDAHRVVAIFGYLGIDAWTGLENGRGDDSPETQGCLTLP